jgi:hypothetical protein
LEVEITRLQMKAGYLKPVVDPRDRSTRLERCERYARWRYQAYRRGEVSSL